MPNTNKLVNNNHQKKNLKRFGIISAVIFSFIIVLSLVYINSCNASNANCGSIYLQVIHSIILSAGLIGLGYCILILKSFDVKVDQDIERNYKDMIKELEKSESKINTVIDDDTVINNDDDDNNKEKIPSFF